MVGPNVAEELLVPLVSETVHRALPVCGERLVHHLGNEDVGAHAHRAQAHGIDRVSADHHRPSAKLDAETERRLDRGVVDSERGHRDTVHVVDDGSSIPNEMKLGGSGHSAATGSGVIPTGSG